MTASCITLPSKYASPISVAFVLLMENEFVKFRAIDKKEQETANN